MYSQNNKIILHVSYKPQVLFDFFFYYSILSHSSLVKILKISDEIQPKRKRKSVTRNDNTFFFFFFFVFSDISLISNCVVSSNTKLIHFFYFLLLHLLPSFLSPRRCNFSASFFFFFLFPSFLHIYYFFLSLLFSSLHIDAFVGFIVLFYGFICF